MRLATLSVGIPVLMRDGDEWVRSGIRKAPVTGAVRATRLGLEGDGQADLENHGGEFKAVQYEVSDAVKSQDFEVHSIHASVLLGAEDTAPLPASGQ